MFKGWRSPGPLYMFTVFDRMYGNPAQNTVYTPYILLKIPHIHRICMYNFGQP